MSETMNVVSWFELPTRDLERARSFYEHVLGVELTLQELGPLRMAWFPMHQGAPGATGSLVQAEAYEPSHKGSLVYLSLQSLTALGN